MTIGKSGGREGVRGSDVDTEKADALAVDGVVAFGCDFHAAVCAGLRGLPALQVGDARRCIVPGEAEGLEALAEGGRATHRDTQAEARAAHGSNMPQERCREAPIIKATNSRENSPSTARCGEVQLADSSAPSIHR